MANIAYIGMCYWMLTLGSTGVGINLKPPIRKQLDSCVNSLARSVITLGISHLLLGSFPSV